MCDCQFPRATSHVAYLQRGCAPSEPLARPLQQAVDPPCVVAHEQADAVARSGDVYALSRVAVSVALADDDLGWSTALLLSLARHENANVRGNALLGFGHLARRFRAIASTAAVAAAITTGLADADAFVRGQADAAADDFQQFIGPLASFEPRLPDR